MGGRRLGILTPDGRQVVARPMIVNPAPKPTQGAVNPLAMRPAYAPGSATRQASMPPPVDPARPDTHIVRRYQGMQPSGDLRTQQALIAPMPDYITDVQGNRVYLSPNGAPSTDMTQRQMRPTLADTRPVAADGAYRTAMTTPTGVVAPSGEVVPVLGDGTLSQANLYRPAYAPGSPTRQAAQGHYALNVRGAPGAALIPGQPLQPSGSSARGDFDTQAHEQSTRAMRDERVLPAATEARDAAAQRYEDARRAHYVLEVRYGGDLMALSALVYDELARELGREPTQDEVDARLAEWSVQPTDAEMAASQAALDEAESLYTQTDATVAFYGGATTKPEGVVGWVFNLLDTPRQAVATQIGGLIHEVAAGTMDPETVAPGVGVDALLGEIGLGPNDWVAFAQAHPNEIAHVYQYGYDADGDGTADFTGDRAVWEYYIGQKNVAQRFLYDLGIDPFSWTPAPAAGGRWLASGSRGLREVPDGARAANLPRRVLSRTGEVAGQALQAPYVLTDVLPEQIVRGTGRAIRRGMGFADPVTGRVFGPSPAGRLDQDLRRQADATYPFYAREARTDLNGNPLPPAGAAPTPPSAPPLVTTPPTVAPSPVGPTVAAPQTVVNPATVVTPPRGRTGFAPGSGRRVAAPAPQTVAPDPTAEVTPPVVDVAPVVDTSGTVNMGRTWNMPPDRPPGSVVEATEAVPIGPRPPRTTQEAPRPADAPPPRPTPERPATARTGAQEPRPNWVRVQDGETPPEVWRRIGRERYEQHRAQMQERSISQPDKDIIAGRFLAEQRRIQRELSPDAPLPEPTLTDTRRFRDDGSQIPPTDKDILTDAVQRQMYRPWTDPETGRARRLLYERGVFRDTPPKPKAEEAIYRRIVDGTYRPRGNPERGTVPRTNTVASSLPNMTPERRQQLANEWYFGEQRAYERYQDARAIRAEIEPSERFGVSDESVAIPVQESPPRTPDPMARVNETLDAGRFLPAPERGVEQAYDADFITAPVTLPNGGRAIYVGRSTGDMPARVVERVQDGERRFDLEMAYPSATNGWEWKVSSKPFLRGVAGTGSPEDYLGAARSLLPDVERLRARAAEGGEAFTRAYQPRPVRLDDDLAREQGRWDEIEEFRREDEEALRDLERREAEAAAAEQAGPFPDAIDVPARESNPFAGVEPPRGTVGIIGNPKAHAAFNAIADALSRPTVRKNRGYARASDQIVEYPVEGFVGSGAPRRMASDVEQATFTDPALRFADGTSWWEFVRTRIDEQTNTGTEVNEAVATALSDLATKAAKDRGIGKRDLPTLLRGYDAYLNAYREITMYNLARAVDQPATQLLGNVTTAAVTGNARAALNMVSPLELVGRFAKPNSKLSRFIRPSGDRLVEGFGLGRQRAGGAISTFDPAEAGQRSMAIERYLEKHIGTWPGRGISFIPANRWVRDWAFASDRFTRETLWSTHFRRLVPTALKDLRDEGYRLVADKANLPPSVVDEVYGRWRKLLRTGLPPETVYADMDAALRRAGVNDRTAAEMARNMEKRWANATERVADEAGREVQRIFFSGIERNIDRVLRRAALFHYFTSRQAILYASEALASPRLMANYGRAVEGLERYAEEHGMPPYMTGFVKLWKTVGGFQIYLNPVATLMTFATFREASGDDEGFLSQVVNSFFLSPLIKGAVEYLGVVEPSFLSDPTALRPLVQNAIRVMNVLRANDLIPGDTPIFENKIDEWEQSLRQTLSTWAADLGIPGAEPIMAEQVGGTERDKFNTRIWQLALEEGQAQGLEGPSLYEYANERADRAYDDPDDPLFEQAFEDYAEGQAVEGAINLSGPVQARDRLPARDALMETTAILRGERPTDGQTYYGTDTPVDRSPAVGSEEDALNQATFDARGDAAASPEGRALGGQDEAYRAIGTPEQQEAYGTYIEIANGLDDDPTVKGPNAGPRTVTIGGETYTEADLQAAEAAGADRYEIADAWAAENGVTDDVRFVQEGRRAYRDEHPEYDDFKEWQSAVYKYEGGPIAWWEAQPEGSPAGIYYREQVARGLEEDRLIGALTSTDAYLATQGVEATVYGPELPEPEQDPVLATQPASGDSGASGGYARSGARTSTTQQADPAQALEDDIRAYHAEVQAVSGILVAAGLPANALTSGNEMLEESARNVLNAYGIDPPAPSGDAGDYLDWVRGQPPGADTSIDTYLVYAEQRDADLAALMLPYQTAGGDIDPRYLSQYGQRPSVADAPQGGYGTVNIGTRLARPRFFGDEFDLRMGGSLGTRLRR